MTDILRIGTRGSPMALVQARIVADRLAVVFGEGRTRIVAVHTGPGRGQQSAEVGQHTSALQRALAAAEIDIAVHSYKDLPAIRPAGLIIAAVPLRDDPRDVLVSRTGQTLRQLPVGSRIGTSSPRRAVQLMAIRAGVEVVPIHGNVDNRVGRLDAGDFDAIAVSLAGLRRLGLEARAAEVFSVYDVLPAPAASALAVECRAIDADVREMLRSIDDPIARQLVTAERAFLAALGGDCDLPAGAYAERFGSTLKLHAMLAVDGVVYRAKNAGQSDAAAGLGRELAAELLGRSTAPVSR